MDEYPILFDGKTTKTFIRNILLKYKNIYKRVLTIKLLEDGSHEEELVAIKKQLLLDIKIQNRSMNFQHIDYMRTLIVRYLIKEIDEKLKFTKFHFHNTFGRENLEKFKKCLENLFLVPGQSLKIEKYFSESILDVFVPEKEKLIIKSKITISQFSYFWKAVTDSGYISSPERDAVSLANCIFAKESKGGESCFKAGSFSASSSRSKNQKRPGNSNVVQFMKTIDFLQK